MKQIEIEDGKTFGFIITTYINSSYILQYIIDNILSIIYLYPKQKIVLINDGSTLDKWKEQLIIEIQKYSYDINNIIFIDVPKELQGKGEMNPYYYFYYMKFFDYAIILNDGCKAISPIKKVNYDLKFMWYFNYQHGWDKSMVEYNETRPEIKTHEDEIIFLLKKIKNKEISNQLIQTYYDKCKWLCCYASMVIISYDYLVQMQEKTQFLELYDYIENRKDRISLESLIGVYDYYVSRRELDYSMLAIQNFMGDQVIHKGEDNFEQIKKQLYSHIIEKEENKLYKIVLGEYFTKISFGR
jgi:hypothetical protein